MSSSLASVPVTKTFVGHSKINFFEYKNNVSVIIDTERLHMRSVTASDQDYENYSALYGDPNVMAKWVNGQTKTPKEIKERINTIWVKRSQEKDPYISLAVFRKDKPDKFLGQVVLGHGDEPGQSELGYLFHKKHWNKGYGTEAVVPVVREYAPATVAAGYTLEGKPLEKITATTRFDNPASAKILEKAGMHKIGEEEKYGALRYLYSINLSELPKKV